MPASPATPKLPPFRCSQHIAWQLGGMQHVVLDLGPDGGELLHTGPGFQHPKGIYFHPGIAEAVGEALATRLAVTP